MSGAKPSRNDRISAATLRPYAGRWVAIIGRQVVAVGETRQEAWIAARRQRPKEKPILRFVGPTSR